MKYEALSEVSGGLVNFYRLALFLHFVFSRSGTLRPLDLLPDLGGIWAGERHHGIPCPVHADGVESAGSASP